MDVFGAPKVGSAAAIGSRYGNISGTSTDIIYPVSKLVNGQFFAQPNNRMLWYEQSLTPSVLKTPDFKVATKYYFCEQDSKWVFGDSDDYFYKEKERK